MVTPMMLMLSVFSTLGKERDMASQFTHTHTPTPHTRTYPWQNPTHCQSATSLPVLTQTSVNIAAALATLSSL